MGGVDLHVDVEGSRNNSREIQINRNI